MQAGAEVPKEGESKALPAPAGEQAAAAAGDSRQEAVKQVQKAMQVRVFASASIGRAK
jgi:hypothetical protein